MAINNSGGRSDAVPQPFQSGADSRTQACALIESKGRRIFSLEAEIGGYNDPIMEHFYGNIGAGHQGRGTCMLFQCEADRAPEGHTTFPRMRLVNYDSVTDYTSWEPASITSLEMETSLDDPWAEIKVVKPLGAAYSVNSNWVAGLTNLAEFEGDEADSLMSYLFTGRWDRSTLVTSQSQRYGRF